MQTENCNGQSQHIILSRESTSQIEATEVTLHESNRDTKLGCYAHLQKEAATISLTQDASMHQSQVFDLADLKRPRTSDLRQPPRIVSIPEDLRQEALAHLAQVNLLREQSELFAANSHLYRRFLKY